MTTSTNSSTRPDFRAKFTWGVDGSVLWLKDEGIECRSLTNDIENCLVELTAYLPCNSKLSDYHIIYRDSEGEWDAIAITEMGDVSLDLRLLQDYNKRGVAYYVQRLKFRFFPISLETYDEAVSSIVTNRMYKHFNIPFPQFHNLN